jgi:hypothetical protein
MNEEGRQKAKTKMAGETIESKNKAFVLALDTLFNRRDYAAAERLWSPNYIQHSAHIAPGRERLFNLVRSVPKTELLLEGASAVPSREVSIVLSLKILHRIFGPDFLRHGTRKRLKAESTPQRRTCPQPE